MKTFRLFVTVAVLASVCGVAGAREDLEIPKLIDQLAVDARLKEGDPEYEAQVGKCREAFRKLMELGEAALPFLIEHLDDERSSIPTSSLVKGGDEWRRGMAYRRHPRDGSIGGACQATIYFQLTDHPKDYSIPSGFYGGYYRIGRDRGRHVRPYFESTPFEEAGGLKAWLEQNGALSYQQKQIHCLGWFLNREKAIGAVDATGYFDHILPLEIRLRERQVEMGEDVKLELARLRRIMNEKAVKEVPPELLPKHIPEKTLEKLLVAIRANIPKGWSVAYDAEHSWLEVERCEKAPAVFVAINASPGDLPKEEPMLVYFSFRVTALVPPGEYRARAVENAEISKKVRALYDDLKKRNVPHMIDRFSPREENDRRTVTQFEALQKTFHSLPDYQYRELSLWWEQGQPGIDMMVITDESIRKERDRVRQKVMDLLMQYKSK